jgi:hypothetical protein
MKFVLLNHSSFSKNYPLKILFTFISYLIRTMDIKRMLKVNKSMESLMKAKLRYINLLACHKKIMAELGGVVYNEDSSITSEEFQQVVDLSNKVLSNVQSDNEGRILEHYKENSNFVVDEVDKVLGSKRSFSSTGSICQGGAHKRRLQSSKKGRDKRLNIMTQCRTILKRLMNHKHGYQVSAHQKIWPYC